MQTTTTDFTLLANASKSPMVVGGGGKNALLNARNKINESPRIREGKVAYSSPNSLTQTTNSILSRTVYILRAAISFLNSAVCILRSTNSILQSTVCILNSANSFLRSTVCILRSTISILKSTICNRNSGISFKNSTI